MPRRQPSDHVDAIESALSAWGPLALDREGLRHFYDSWAVERDKYRPDQYVALHPDFTVSAQGGFTFTHQGDCGINGDGYTRVEAVAGRSLPAGKKVAIVPIVGTVTPFQAPKWYAEYGIRVAALPNIVTAARAAANDAEVGRIIYAVHSPGGSAFGVGEAAASLREVSKLKQTAAAITYLSASAAYWLTSTAREVVAEQSALVGSVGVRVTHIEVSKALDMDGVTVTELSMPVSKSDVSPYKPLTDTARAELMAIVESQYKTFAADISAARRIDMTNVGEQYGRVHPASKAKSIGMIDRVATFEALIGESAPETDLTSTRRARLAVMERKYRA